MGICSGRAEMFENLRTNQDINMETRSGVYSYKGSTLVLCWKPNKRYLKNSGLELLVNQKGLSATCSILFPII